MTGLGAARAWRRSVGGGSGREGTQVVGRFSELDRPRCQTGLFPGRQALEKSSQHQKMFQAKVQLFSAPFAHDIVGF